MAAGDIKKAYAASVALTVTNLHSLATSATWVAGWESAEIDNTVNLYLDYAVEALIRVGAAPTAGEIRMYLVKERLDATWPDVFDGTESAETITDTEIRDAIARPAAATVTDATASRDYFLTCPSVAAVFGGNMPRKFSVFITHSTVQALAATTNAVAVTGSYETVAP